MLGNMCLLKNEIKKIKMRNFIKIYKRLEYIHQLIKFQNTGPAKQLAEKLKISERTVFNLFNTLKALGYNIEYSFANNTYLFTEETNKQKAKQKRGAVA